MCEVRTTCCQVVNSSNHFWNSYYPTLLTVTSYCWTDDLQTSTSFAYADVQEASLGGKVPHSLEEVYSEDQACKEVAAVFSYHWNDVTDPGV